MSFDTPLDASRPRFSRTYQSLGTGGNGLTTLEGEGVIGGLHSPVGGGEPSDLLERDSVDSDDSGSDRESFFPNFEEFREFFMVDSLDH